MKQINKAQARKMYAMDKPFIIVPCNMRPNSVFAITVCNGMWGHENFDSLYNEFCYYNCSNETGRYPRFYIEED
jgi:hypothetical protein